MRSNLTTNLLATIREHGRGMTRQFHSIHEDRHTWSVLNYIYQNRKRPNDKYACFLLNISDESFRWFDRYKFIWDQADLRVAVDGSANCLAKRRLLNTAHVISGDFDSIDPKLIERLHSPRKAPGFKDSSGGADHQQIPLVVETPCQKSTDFTKAIRVAQELKPKINNHIGLYYSDGSRVDHMFGLINTLHIIRENIFILNIQSGTVSWLLRSGNHAILKPRGQEQCSLVPFTGPTEAKSQGLRYNLNPTSPLSFGTIVSTSNMCQENRDKILIETNRDILWSIDLSKQSSTPQVNE